MSETILVVNAGSSSIKFQLFAVGAGDQLQRRLKGQIEGIGVHPHLVAKGAKGEVLIDETGLRPKSPTCRRRSARSSNSCAPRSERLPIAVGHRVVHGGPDYSAPILDRCCRGRAACRHSRRSRLCTSRIISARSAPCCNGSLTYLRSPASTRPFIGATLKLPTVTRCLSSSIRRACAATAFTACPTNTSQANCRGRARHRQGPRGCRASRQRRLNVRNPCRKERREHHGLHRARRTCRWERGRVSSMRASCSTSSPRRA